MHNTLKLSMGMFVALSLGLTANAQTDEDEVIVTGTRITQGGAQDINYFCGEVELGRIPHAKAFTSEGLLSQHDLFLQPIQKCVQTLCLVAESMQNSATYNLGADYFLGVGFDSNISEQTWHRAPLNLVAVVDKSGSMSGEPLDKVKKSLQAIIKQLEPGDQFSIVLYGAEVHTHLQPIIVTRHNQSVLVSAVSSIKSSGSTYMEAGLKLGYATALETVNEFEGNTRLMLFTDERPNVGPTDADSFMGMARSGSKQNIGLTTIGVGVQFGAELATKISSVKGGNLFFLRDDEDIKNLFSKEFDFMVSEVAHDLKVEIAPAKGTKITGVYGLPQNMFTWKDERSIEMHVPTVFLSSNGGGIFLTLDRENPDLPALDLQKDTVFANVHLSYRDAKTGLVGRQELQSRASLSPPSTVLQKAHLLVNEYKALRTATNAFHLDNDQEKAYQIMRQFSQTLKASEFTGLESEQELVAGLTTKLGFLAGHEGLEGAPQYAQLWNEWRIVKIKGGIDLRTGDVLKFTPDQKFSIYRKWRSLEETDEVENYALNEQQIYLEESDLVFKYSISKKGRLRLRHPDGELTIYLKPVKKGES